MSADDENRFRPKPGRIRSDAPKGGKTKSFLTQAKKIARQHSTTSSRSSPRPGKTSTAKGGKGARSTGGPGVRRGRGAAFVRARTLSGGWRHSAPGMRRVVVKTRYVKEAGRNGRAAAHLRYIQRDGTSRDGERGDIGACLGRQRTAGRTVLVVAAGAGIVGREHRADIAVAIPHLAQISRACEDVVAGLIGIAAEPVTGTEARPGVGHNLHQSHRAGRRNRAHVARALGAQDGANPVLGDAEPLRRLGDVRGIGIDGNRAHDRRGLRDRDARSGAD